MAKTGNFDLNFPGAHIICDTQDKRNALVSFLTGKTNSIDLPLCKNQESDLERAIFNTTYIHEGKHLHDHLLCPQLVHNYILKLTALFYSTLAINEWNNGNRPYKYIPVPFTKWIELPNEKKKELLEDDDILSTDVPMFTLNDAAKVLSGEMECDNAFTKSILLAALHYSEYRYNINQRSYDGYNIELSIRAFTESSAYVQQVTEIALKYGSYGESLQQIILNDSFKHFQKLGKQQRDAGIPVEPARDYIGYTIYTSAFTMIWRYAIQSKINLEYIYPFISHVLFWALSGNVLEGNKDANYPRNRIERLFNLDYMGIDLELNKDTNMLELFNTPLETFKKWDYYIAAAYAGKNMFSLSQDASFSLNAYSTPIDLSSFYDKLLGNLAQMIQYIGSLGFSETANYMYNIANSCFYMKKQFMDNPSGYLTPYNYSNNTRDFVNVPFVIDFDGVKPICESECVKVRDGIGFVSNRIYGDSLNDSAFSAMMPKLDWHIYVDASKYIDFSDALLGEFKKDVPGDLIRDFFPGIAPWFYS